MTSQPRPPQRGDGDGWVEGPDGTRRWGTHGAAGILAVDPARGVLLQHRVEWSHFGGTWGIPGGAIRGDETPLVGALREASEEAALPAANVRPLLEHRLELGWWRYSTLAVRVDEPFEPVVSDAESLELAWVALADVDALPLHPGFADSWPLLRPRLAGPDVVVVDAANVLGSRGDGWWRDRAGATSALLAQIAALTDTGLPGAVLGRDDAHTWPDVRVVLEGQARGAVDVVTSGGSPWRRPALAVERAPGEGDDAIVAAVRAAIDGGATPDTVTVITADAGLRDRVHALGARTSGPGAYRRALDAAAPPATAGASTPGPGDLPAFP